MKSDFSKIINSLEDLRTLAEELRPIIMSIDYGIVYFYGDLGVGKTQFIDFLLVSLIKEKVTSPTFNILNIYTGYKEEKYLHFDLYRKNSINRENLQELGLDLLFENKKNKCFIEWSEQLSDQKYKFHNSINITIKKINDRREIIYTNNLQQLD